MAITFRTGHRTASSSLSTSVSLGIPSDARGNLRHSVRRMGARGRARVEAYVIGPCVSARALRRARVRAARTLEAKRPHFLIVSGAVGDFGGRLARTMSSASA